MKRSEKLGLAITQPMSEIMALLVGESFTAGYLAGARRSGSWDTLQSDLQSEITAWLGAEV